MTINGPAERKLPNQQPELAREITIRQAWVVSLHPSLPCDGDAGKPEEGWAFRFYLMARNSDLKRGASRGHLHSSFGWTSQRFAARSSTLLTHADRVSPALAAALPYAASRSSDTRIVSQRLSPLATGGLPSGFFMGALCTNK
jgi:hypothetical protein